MLSTGARTHDHPSTADVAKLLVLAVSRDIDPMIYEVVRFYPRPARQRAAVEYLLSRRESPAQHETRPKV